MPYACADVIYGINFSDEDYDKWPALSDLEEEEQEGVHAPYSGHSDPFAFGVDMGWSFDECGDELPSGSLEVTPEIEAEFQRLFQALPAEQQAAIQAFADEKELEFPRRFFLWSTS